MAGGSYPPVSAVFNPLPTQDLQDLTHSFKEWLRQISDLAPAEGVYTPTVVGITNVTSVVAQECAWAKYGKVVIVSGSFTLDPVATGTTEFSMTVPEVLDASDIIDICGGLATRAGNTTSSGVVVYTQNDETVVYFKGNLPHSLSSEYNFIFQYRKGKG